MDFRAAVGSSNKKDIHAAVNEALSSAQRKISGQEIDLACVFATVELAKENLLKNIKQLLKPGVPLIGCSGMQLITPEGVLKNGLSILLLSCPGLKISSSSIDQLKEKGAFSGGQELGSYLISTVKGYRRELCLIFSDGLLEDTANFLKGLQSALGTSFPLIGGGSADNLSFRQTFQFHNESILHNGAVACLFSGKLNYGFGIRHGWKPLGKVHTVTASTANIIREIDGKRAAGLYEDYFSKSLEELQKEILHINILYPLGIYLDAENEYLLRNVVLLNNSGSLITEGAVAEGAQIRLMIGTKDSCLQAACQAATQVKLDTQDKKIDLLFIISSASRARLLGRNTEEEIKAVREIIGKNIPFIGFYGYGQQAPLKTASYYGQSYCHNQAIAILGIGS